MIDDLALMKLRAGIKFTSDAEGRMLLTGEPCEQARRLAPRFTVGHARGGYTARFGATLPDRRVRELQRLIDRLAPVEGVRFPEATLGSLREILGGLESGISISGGDHIIRRCDPPD